MLAASPEAPGCYALTNFSGDVLYIGQAHSLRSRLLQHFGLGKHNESTRHGRISLVRVLVLEGKGQLNAYERGWLNQCLLADGELPPLNLVSAPV